jgi:hypothetical protein
LASVSGLSVDNGEIPSGFTVPRQISQAEGEAERLCSSAIAVPCNPGGAANTSHGSVRSFPYL